MKNIMPEVKTHYRRSTEQRTEQNIESENLKTVHKTILGERDLKQNKTTAMQSCDFGTSSSRQTYESQRQGRKAREKIRYFLNVTHRPTHKTSKPTNEQKAHLSIS
jgi:hypothetical protein